MKVIGITTSNFENTTGVNKAYVKAFTTDTTIPILIPHLSEIDSELQLETDSVSSKVRDIVSKIDALVLSGGADINPLVFDIPNDHSNGTNIERDIFEMALFNECLRQHKPIFGICKGMQLIGNCLGLHNFHQELNSVKQLNEIHNGNIISSKQRNEPTHSIKLYGRLRELYQFPNIHVNSFHHQGFTIRADGNEFSDRELEQYENSNSINIIATTDSVLEGFTYSDTVMAVQFHPEEYNKSIFIDYFINKYLTD